MDDRINDVWHLRTLLEAHAHAVWNRLEALDRRIQSLEETEQDLLAAVTTLQAMLGVLPQGIGPDIATRVQALEERAGALPPRPVKRQPACRCGHPLEDHSSGLCLNTLECLCRGYASAGPEEDLWYFP